jgi:hypothetical protein
MEPKMQPKNWRRKDLTRESNKNCRQRLEKKEPGKRNLTKIAAKKLEKKEPDKRIS